MQGSRRVRNLKVSSPDDDEEASYAGGWSLQLKHAEDSRLGFPYLHATSQIHAKLILLISKLRAPGEAGLWETENARLLKEVASW